MTEPASDPGHLASPRAPHPTSTEQAHEHEQHQHQHQHLDAPVDDTSHDLESSAPPPLPQPQPFQPIFTLVTDATSRATHHPNVQYIFSDDDPDILTEALAHHSAPANPNHRAIVIDLIPKTPPLTATLADPPTYEVACASSLTADWAVVSTKLTPLASASSTAPPPSQSSDGDTSSSPPRLMLRVEGVDVPVTPPTSSKRVRKSSTATAKKKSLSQEESTGGSSLRESASGDLKQREDVAGLVGEFERRMGLLDRVVDAGKERVARMGAKEGGESEGGEGFDGGTVRGQLREATLGGASGDAAGNLGAISHDGQLPGQPPGRESVSKETAQQGEQSAVH